MITTLKLTFAALVAASLVTSAAVAGPFSGNGSDRDDRVTVTGGGSIGYNQAQHNADR